MADNGNGNGNGKNPSSDPGYELYRPPTFMESMKRRFQDQPILVILPSCVELGFWGGLIRGAEFALASAKSQVSLQGRRMAIGQIKPRVDKLPQTYYSGSRLAVDSAQTKKK